ncbi:D-allose-binding periplasmic protein precursor [Polystyrenella longa]|uniref:D-allose-binding periplasmic protein n=1 Tax=Polystyrenella longa TaxID=2528007 RepID=A0A518CNZ6_9PLAN|nr:sugar ABC transporter substrate-binding protein [Polystyrenella longa]QDU80938.1 D-allose-binding periplasmic protein precursor [Polystyrenella longa]
MCAQSKTIPGQSLFKWVFLLILFSFMMTGCTDGPDTSDSTSDEPKKPRIALVMKSLANEFFSTMAEGARTHQAAHADQYELLVDGIKDERDVSRQVQLIEEMMVQQVDAIVIAPADSKSLVTACRRAQEQGIVVINIDNKLDAEVLTQQKISIPFVGPDNKAGAKEVGDYLAGKLAEGDEVALLEGIPTAYNAQQRKAGFMESIEAAGLNLVSSQSAQWEMDRANQVAGDIMTQQPGLKAFFCSNDSMALGTLAAVRSADKLGQVQIVGFDNINAVQEAIKAGNILATADQHGDQLAVFGIEYALEILESGGTPDDKETPVDLVTQESLAASQAAE